MTVRVVVGRVEGLVSSVGLMAEGLPFLCRGVNNNGLHWESAEARRNAVRELRYLLAYLKLAGVVVENIEALDTLEVR